MIDDRETDWTVLVMLLDGDCTPWSIEEIAREIGDLVVVADSLNRLHRAGLIQRCSVFAFPTRPARRFEELRA